MKVFYSLVVIFGIGGENYSVPIEDELTKADCTSKAKIMRTKTKKEGHLPFTVDDASTQIHSVEGTEYVCVPSSFENL